MPFSYENNPTGVGYLNMISKMIIPHLQQSCSVRLFNLLRSIKDDAAANQSICVRQTMHEIFNNRIIGFNHTVE